MTKLTWTKLDTDSSWKCWRTVHEGVKYLIVATRYRGGPDGARYTAWSWQILSHRVGDEGPGASNIELKKPGFATYSGFRRLSQQVEDHVNGVAALEPAANRY